ncbi:hypothetical protein AAFC00_004132 [Neodothiora populina]|uniref:Mediator of RNA polymerase II transcription subunit 11 n=1 Tax=Neodothiora populina TaxID=2781224 RepID=A0ABR3PIN4_9PEZI
MAPAPMTPAERIRELSAISADVPAMLSSAGNAISALTNKPIDREEDEENGTNPGPSKNASVVAHKELFTENAKAYLVNLQAIMARLRRQAYALEEAGIIAPEAPALSSTGDSVQRAGAAAAAPTAGMARRGAPGQGGAASQRQQNTDDGERITNGGLGNLDVGLLNSRGNSVGIEKEAELIAEAKELLKEFNKPKGSGE